MGDRNDAKGMRCWLLTAALLGAGCSGQSTPGPDSDQDRAPASLSEMAARIEGGCGLAEASLLHATPRGDLEIRPAARSGLSYSQFSCVWAALEQAGLEERGVQIILTGGDAAR